MKDFDCFWWRKYRFAYISLALFIYIAKTVANSALFYAMICAYGIYGVIRLIITNEIMIKVWDKVLPSYNQSKKIALARGYSDTAFRKHMAAPLDPEVRKPFKWASITIGLIEGIIYTTAVVFGQLGLIAFWLGFKAIGEWNDSPKGSVTRIRINNFVIGNGISLMTGIIGGIIFWYLYRPAVLLHTIDTAYQFTK